VTRQSVCEHVEFAPVVLRGLAELGPFDLSEADLALELGLSAWMRFSATTLDDARSTMLHIRSVLLEAGEMDSHSEPIPFSGRSPRLDMLNLAAYLGNLVERAAWSAQCDPEVIVERTIERLAA
jgi:hypothetical protein